jgi:hypothetical protein
MPPRYEANLRKLRRIGFDVGRADQYALLPETTPALSRALAAMRTHP